MLNTRLRKQIEWHFCNHQADRALRGTNAKDIAESGLSINKTFNSTESKGMLLYECGNRGTWAKVVENTYIRFPPWSPEHETMLKLYKERLKWEDIFSDGVSKSTFLYWREKWLMEAYMWAKYFNLM